MDDSNSEMRRKITLRNGEAYLKGILNTVVDGVITIDTRGIIQAFNPAADRLFNTIAAEIIDQNVKILIKKPHKSAHNTYPNNFLTTGGGKKRELEAQRKCGETFPIELGVNFESLIDAAKKIKDYWFGAALLPRALTHD